MYIIVLITCLILGFHLNYAVHFNISAKRSGQSFVLNEGDYPIVMRVFDIRDDMSTEDCSGKCLINSTQKIKSTCNLIHKEGFKYLNVLIDKRVVNKYTGTWSCVFTIDGIQQGSKGFEYFDFDINVKSVDLSALPKLTELSRLVLSEPSLVAETSLEPKRVTVINITAPETEVTNYTLNEGDQDVKIIIPGIQYMFSSCDGRCEIKNKNISAPCLGKVSEETGKTTAMITLDRLKVDKEYSTIWNCHASVLLPIANNSNNIEKQIITRKINIKVINPSNTEIWLYCAYAGAGCLVLLVIIGQTMCILHFKAKAKKAQMDKNMMPKYSNSTLTSDPRYTVKDNTGSVEVTRDSVIYEVLETVREQIPIPPPIETLPGSGSRPKHMRRSMSYSDLINDDAPHQVLNSLQHPRKNNTFNRFSSLERKLPRPPLPLPTDEIYEDVTVLSPVMTPEPKKATSLFQKNKSQEKSPLIAPKQKKSVFSKNPEADQNLREPLGRKPMVPSQRPLMMASGLPSPEARPPFALGKPSPIGLSANPKTVSAATPVLPSVISPSMITNFSAKLKPVKPTPRPPVEEPSRMAPGTGFRMPPVDSSRMQPRAGFGLPPVDGPRMTQGFRIPPGAGKRMPPEDTSITPPKDAFRTPPRNEPRTPPDGFRTQLKNEPKIPPDGLRLPPRNDSGMPPGGSRNVLRDEPRMPAGDWRMSPRDVNRVPPVTSRILPGAGFRMPQRDDTRMPPGDSRSPPVLPMKPKLPSPVPEPIEPDSQNEPSQKQGYYNGSSDEEFDNYDVLPDFRIYGNAPPKKFI